MKPQKSRTEQGKLEESSSNEIHFLASPRIHETCVGRGSMGARQPMGSQKLIEVSKTARNKDEWNIRTVSEPISGGLTLKFP